ncbi:27696_t:CDS:1, partial [Racocetra persica]
KQPKNFLKKKFPNASQKRSHQVLNDELKVLEKSLKPGTRAFWKVISLKQKLK